MLVPHIHELLQVRIDKRNSCMCIVRRLLSLNISAAPGQIG